MIENLVFQTGSHNSDSIKKIPGIFYKSNFMEKCLSSNVQWSKSLIIQFLRKGNVFKSWFLLMFIYVDARQVT